MRSGVAPYGFCYLEGKLVVDTREHGVILQMVRLWQEGNSYSAVAKILNGREVKSRKGKNWRKSTVQRAVTRYLGKEG